MQIKNHKKNLKKIKIAWIGDGNNVCNSLILGCAKLKIQLSVAIPDGYEPEFDVIKIGKEAELLEVSDNPETAVQDADVVMMLRTQWERQNEVYFPSIREYSRLFG